MAGIAMPLFTIDTLQFSKRMQRAGLQQSIADELAESLKENCSASIDGLATKEDIHLLKTDISSLRSDMKLLEQKIANVENKITIKMFVMLMAAVGSITWFDKMVG